MQLLKPSWVNHDEGQAMFSVDIHPDGSRFATGGQGQGQDASGRVVIWNLKPVLDERAEQNSECPKLLCQLDQHLGCVNCVRWSRSGHCLASAGDDKVIIIWQLSNYGGGSAFGSNVVNVEWWRCVSTLRGHDGDILDVSWAPHDIYLASVSIDNTVIVWNAAKWPERVRILRGHQGLVKGVTWDPVGRYVASQADDRSLIVWRTSDWQQEITITKPFQECGGTTSVLRPSWSPDGQYLVSAHAMNNGGPTAQIIDRDHWTTDKDFVGHRKPITCVRFNPNILRKKGKNGKAVQYCSVAIGSRDRSISIWFTYLKRPLVVIHDIFEDSVLDLAFSSCGRHLLAVSKDGTLAAISFSQEEMGRTLTKDETDAIYLKLYGQCSTSNNHLQATAIIDNPELLKARELAKKQLTSSSEPVCRSGPMQRGPDKQIECRTADGRRRITPVFIPPAADGTPFKKFESFLSSRAEKSQIIIEKVDGIVQPNVTSPNKNKTAPNSALPDQAATQAPEKMKNCADDAKTDMTPALPPELESVNPSITARLERASKPLDNKTELNNTPVSLKRKLEDPTPQPIVVKRKRGRPPLDRSQSTVTNSASPVAAATPSIPPLATPANIGPVATAVAGIRPPVITAAIAASGQLLPPAVITTPSPRMQLTRIGHDGQEQTFNVIIENNWQPLGGTGGHYVHRVSRRTVTGAVDWAVHLTAPISASEAGESYLAITCADSSLQLLCLETGHALVPSVQLRGACSHMCVRDSWLLLVTTTAWLCLWHVPCRRVVIDECVRHLVEGRPEAESVKSIHLVEVSGTSDKSGILELHRESSTNDNSVKRKEVREIDKNNKDVVGNCAVQGKVSATTVNFDSNKSNKTANDAKHDPVSKNAANSVTKSLQKEANKSSLTDVKCVVKFVPALVLNNGDVFVRCRELQNWLLLGEVSTARRAVYPQFATLPPLNSTSSSGRGCSEPPLAALLRYSSAFQGPARNFSTNFNAELRSVLTEDFIKKMLFAAAYIGSAEDFRFWYTRLVQFYVSNGEESKLRKIFDELLCSEDQISSLSGPVSTVLPSHHQLLGTDRRALLSGFLNELLLTDTAGRLQRLYAEYKEQLDSYHATNRLLL